MANSFGTETPPAPNPGMGNALMSGSGSSPQGGPQPSGPSAPGAQQMPAPPTHAQTVAALRHFDAIRHELEIISADPALGKSNVKSKIIDGVTRLVAGNIMPVTQAVDELAKVPSEPLMQMKWVKAMLSQAADAERSVLAHHAIGFAGQGPAPTPSADDHIDHLAALSKGFRGQ